MNFQCVCCKKFYQVNLEEANYQDWLQGNLTITEAAPNLSTDDANLIVTKICPKCWTGINNDNLKEAIDDKPTNRLV